MKVDRIVLLLLLAIGAAAAACGGAVEEGHVDGAAAPSARSPAPVATATDAASGGAGSVESLTGLVLSPILGGDDGPASAPQTGEIDSRLEGVLLVEGDLPGYEWAGESSSIVRTPEGTIPMAASFFLRAGEPEEEMGSGVVSMAFLLTPEAAAQAKATLARGLDSRDLTDMTTMLSFLQVEQLDAGGLGEQALGLRMRWPSAAGEVSAQTEVFMWLRGERLLAVVAVYPEGEVGPDTRALAAVMDSRAQQS